jgi:hypothetical protein
MKKTIILIALLAGVGFFICPALRAQEVSKAAVTDQEIELMRQDLRSKRKQVIAANIQLNDVEAQKFWPVYDKYAADLRSIYDVRYGLIKEYAEHQKTLTDAQALSLAKSWGESDVAASNLRVRYFSMFEKVTGGKRAALFFQVDRMLSLMLDLQLDSQIPLIQP